MWPSVPRPWRRAPEGRLAQRLRQGVPDRLHGGDHLVEGQGIEHAREG